MPTPFTGTERTALRVVGFQDAEVFGKVLDAALSERTARQMDTPWNPQP